MELSKETLLLLEDIERRIDPETEEVLPYGTPGELVFTSLSKEAFPVVRYRACGI